MVTVLTECQTLIGGHLSQFSDCSLIGQYFVPGWPGQQVDKIKMLTEASSS